MRRENPSSFEHPSEGAPTEGAGSGSSPSNAIAAADFLDPPDHRLPRARAITTLRLRRAREALFDRGLFGDGAWDILLALVIAKVDQRQTTMRDACVAACVPTTTAVRCVGRLVAKGYVHRRRPDAGKRVWLELDDIIFERLTHLLTEGTATTTS
jgi:DNA-binding MarR family transcriptional regulator